MATSESINPTAIGQAEAACSSIANIAETIQRLAELIVDDDADDFDVHKAVAIRELARQAGWLADVAGQKLGVPGYRGGAEQWMLPARFHGEEKDARHG